jgi:hypothetical protein
MPALCLYVLKLRAAFLLVCLTKYIRGVCVGIAWLTAGCAPVSCSVASGYIGEVASGRTAGHWAPLMPTCANLCKGLFALTHLATEALSAAHQCEWPQLCLDLWVCCALQSPA